MKKDNKVSQFDFQVFCVNQENTNKELQKAVVELKDHAKVANAEMGLMVKTTGAIDLKVESVKTDVDWLKRSYWVIATASIGALVSGLIGLLIK